MGRSRFAGCLALSLWCGGALLASHVCASSDEFGWRQGLIVASVLAAGAIAARDWRRAAQGSLRWDGSGWHWCDGARVECVECVERTGRLSVVLDLQWRMLVRFRAHDRRRSSWLWLESGPAAGDWHALRCAVHARSAAGAGCAAAVRSPHDVP